jgi:hypothetical protein
VQIAIWYISPRFNNSYSVRNSYFVENLIYRLDNLEKKKVRCIKGSCSFEVSLITVRFVRVSHIVYIVFFKVSPVIVRVYGPPFVVFIEADAMLLSRAKLLSRFGLVTWNLDPNFCSRLNYSFRKDLNFISYNYSAFGHFGLGQVLSKIQLSL